MDSSASKQQTFFPADVPSCRVDVGFRKILSGGWGGVSAATEALCPSDGWNPLSLSFYDTAWVCSASLEVSNPTVVPETCYCCCLVAKVLSRV